jgi:hypothetical protein
MPARIRRTLGFGVLLASWSASGLMGTGLAMAQSAPRGGAQAAVAGWQGDVPGGTRRLRVEVPVARQGDGAAVTGRVRAELITRRATHTLPLSGGAFSGTHVPYAAASLDQPTATLTQRRRADDPADLVGAVRRAHGVSSRCAAEQRRETSESPPACQGQSTRGCLSQGRPSPARTCSVDRGETDRCDSRDPIGPASARNA